MKNLMLVSACLVLALTTYAQSGCTFSEAYNYDPAAVIDDGSCTKLVCGNYEGPLVVNFSKADNVDPLDPSNQDRITDDCWITRGLQNGLFNAAQQSAWEYYSSPKGTLWKWGDAASANAWKFWYAALQEDSGIGGPGNQTFPFTMTMLLEDGAQFEIEFTNWTSGGSGGGFSYTRTLVVTPECVQVPLFGGCLDSAACNYDATADYDNGSCDPQLGGCTNSLACNYDPNATCDNGTCALTADCNGTCGGNFITSPCGNCVDPALGDPACVEGCTDASACNYDAMATFDDGSCYTDDGNLALVCPDDVTIDLPPNQTTYNWIPQLPILQGTCSQPEAIITLSDAVAGANANLWQQGVGNTFDFIYDGGTSNDNISDGGEDMYDGGNYLNTNFANNIVYTSGATVADGSFGVGSQYATLELPGLFMLAAEPVGLSYFQVSGNLGADGSGTVNGFDFTINGLQCYYKGVCSAGDPSVNHLVIVPEGTGTGQTYPNDTDQDLHRVNVNDPEGLIYVLWAGNNGFCYDQSDVQVLAATIAQSFDFSQDGTLARTSGPGAGAIGDGTYAIGWEFTSNDGMTVLNCSQNLTVNTTVAGCTLSQAYNYDPLATVNDGSCIVVPTCTNYSGPLVVDFTKPNNADWTLPENQDFITPTCILTRADQYALFNIALESGYNGSGESSEPSNTEWKFGTFDAPTAFGTLYQSLASVNYGSANFGDNLPGNTLTMHVIDADLYFEITFNSWSSGGNGGFSYTRTFLPEESGCPEFPFGTGGCLDAAACNYDAMVDYNDGTCVYPGCTDPLFCAYDPDAGCDDGSCAGSGVRGCTDNTATNYDPMALCDNGLCYYGGCVYANACNYDPLALFDDSTCDFASCAGCTYLGATNYSPTATVDDGTCTFDVSGCEGDLDQDGFRGTSDLLQLLGVFATSCE